MDGLTIIESLLNYVDDKKVEEKYEIDRPTRELIRFFAELDGCPPGEMLEHMVREFACGVALEEEEARARMEQAG